MKNRLRQASARCGARENHVAGGQFIFRNDPDRLPEYRNLTAR